MAIKTILLHLTYSARASERIRIASDLTRRFGAHLDVLYLVTPTMLPAGAAGRAATSIVAAEAAAVARDHAMEMRDQVAATCDGLDFSWRVSEGEHAEELARLAPYADLAIVEQSHPAHAEDHIRLQAPEELPLRAACPTLVIPHSGANAAIGRRMLVAWKNTREASRAVRDALPFLVDADEVFVLTAGSALETQTAGAGIMGWLARHGVRANLRPDIGPDDDIGHVILGQADNLGCDSIVMGAYGHARWRELIWGGTTRHVLHHMTVPVFLSH